jgi:hypothetical protein
MKVKENPKVKRKEVKDLSFFQRVSHLSKHFKRSSESTQRGCFCFSSLRIVLMRVEAASGIWLNSVVSSSSEGLLNEGVRSCAQLVLGKCMSDSQYVATTMTR